MDIKSMISGVAGLAIGLGVLVIGGPQHHSRVLESSSVRMR